MGQRCNLAVIRDGETTLYYDHWGANRLDVELLWGPDAATAWVEAHEAVDSAHLLDEVWAEGGAIIDHDRRDLLWYGGEDVVYEIPLRRAYLPLMRACWPGWTVRWARDEQLELARALGFDPAAVLTSDPTAHARPFTLEDGYADAVLTVRRAGVTRVAAVYGGVQALYAGPAPVKALAPRLTATGLVWTDAEFPSAGAHVDFDARTLGFWLADPGCDALARIEPRWPGWRCADWGERFEAHLDRAEVEIALPPIDLVAVQRGLIESFRARCHRATSNPARESLAALTDSGRAVELNPWTDVTAGSVGAAQAKLAILDRLEAGLGPPKGPGA